MTRKDEQWWLSVNHHLVGKTYKSLTNELLFARYITNVALEILKVESRVYQHEFPSVEIRIVKDGVEQAKDVI